MLFSIKVIGRTALLMHAERLADPLNPYAQQIAVASAKRKKTLEDYALLGELEVLGGLYCNNDGPFIPGTWFQASLQRGGTETKNGQRVKKAVSIVSLENRLEYDGPRTPDEIAADSWMAFRKTVKVGMQRVVRTRPRFRNWSCVAYGTLNESVLDLADLQTVAAHAGELYGMGDWRPMHGRFTAEVTKVDAIPD